MTKTNHTNIFIIIKIHKTESIKTNQHRNQRGGKNT